MNSILYLLFCVYEDLVFVDEYIMHLHSVETHISLSLCLYPGDIYFYIF